MLYLTKQVVLNETHNKRRNSDRTTRRDWPKSYSSG
jgi:hypothetical protein